MLYRWGRRDDVGLTLHESFVTLRGGPSHNSEDREKTKKVLFGNKYTSGECHEDRLSCQELVEPLLRKD